MGIGVSIFLIAVGAILAFAVDLTVQGLDLDAVGIILMIVGLIGLAMTLTMAGGWSGPRRRVVYDDGYDEPVERRRVVRER